MTTQFENIYYGAGTDVGKIRFASSGMGWKQLEGDKTVTVSAADIKWIQWLRVARNFQLRIILKEGRRRETFDGFLRDDHDRIAALVKQHFSVTLEAKEISHKGWNWGATDVQGDDLAFLVSNRTAFELPLANIANSNIAGKTEVSLEFANADGGANGKKKARAVDELVEMRFYVPGTHTRDGDDEEPDEETTAAQAFHDMIKEKAEIGQVSGESIVVFKEVLVLTPRGRYDIDMFPTFMRFRGKTYDYKILYTSITRLFLLPKPDEIHVQFVVGLDPPIRQGQTRYPYLVMLFSRDEEMECELKLDEETIATKYNGALQQRYEQPMHEVVAAIFRGLSGNKIIAPSGFSGRDGHTGVKANLKAIQGELYLLGQSLIFVAKQPTLVDFSDIHQIVFSRVGGGMSHARTFDLKVSTKSGSEITFTSINKEEHEPIESYLKGKKVRTKNEMNDDMMSGVVAALSDEDEEMQSVASSGEEAPQPRSMNIDDDDSEDDEDFQASSSDGGSPTGSDSETDEPISDQSGDMEMVKAGKKKLTKKKSDVPGGKEGKDGAKAASASAKSAPKKKASEKKAGEKKAAGKKKDPSDDERPAKKKAKKA
ncbi:hypothetical protein BOTBODRAFT_36725 [Botryobasidium botryosum FD-172 SS1]|uniref:FACT complex subunit POB3 n=1 Tax=Botryobasidium botryosum (strain FD-172 SS1) TaxID=930990 RepID=A0A067MEB6_BOTB1|nr:hypothetical protein BOTBODRAFT_36725 [Botryobasidium botryosum FD-172 SS1]